MWMHNVTARVILSGPEGNIDAVLVISALTSLTGLCQRNLISMVSGRRVSLTLPLLLVTIPGRLYHADFRVQLFMHAKTHARRYLPRYLSTQYLGT